MGRMKTFRGGTITPRERLTQSGAMLVIVVLLAMALLGPRGLLAWREYDRQLELRQTELKTLLAQRDDLRNRVALVDPRKVDPDMAGELLRSDLNVVHPDEVVMLLD